MQLRSGRLLTATAITTTAITTTAITANTGTHVESICRFLVNRLYAVSNIQPLYYNTTKKYWVELSRTLVELYSEYTEYYDYLYECDTDSSDVGLGLDTPFIRLIRSSAKKAFLFKFELMEAMVNLHFKRRERTAVCLAIRELDAFLVKAGIPLDVREPLNDFVSKTDIYLPIYNN
jgi:hypothetical protein